MKTLSICVCTLLAVIACTSPAQSPSGNSLLISPGDELHIAVLDMPEMDQTPRVTDAGDVPVQGIGNVRVANMSPGEAAAMIHDRMVSANFLKHPEVSVVVEQYATQLVTLIGEFKNPGAYPIATARPILDVIALGGGLTDVADRNVLVERHGDQLHPVPYKISNDAQEAIREQVLVNPGDTVVAPKAGIVYVLGDVNRPGGFVMTDNDSRMSLLEALAMAGGVAKTAKLSHTRLIRKTDHTERQVPLGEIQKGKEPDFAMLPGDILFVPFSYAKNLVITSAAGITGAASAAAIYVER